MESNKRAPHPVRRSIKKYTSHLKSRHIWRALLVFLLPVLMFATGKALLSEPALALPDYQTNIGQLFVEVSPPVAAAGASFSLAADGSVRALPLPSVPESGSTLAVISEAGAHDGHQHGTEGITEYIVKEGETVSLIAEKFDLETSTILWANELSRSSVISPGDELIILPTDGVLHYVISGETLGHLAVAYDIPSKEISSFNELEDDAIFIGDLLIIPGGEPVKRASGIASSVPVANNFFICPLAGGCRKTQGIHWYNAVDFSNGSCSEVVVAAAGATVQKTGWHNVAGNYVRLLHSSGVVTFYGHLSTIAVSPGQAVSQGQIIGYTGHTGYTIPAGPGGCHLHFEVRGATNPFAY